MENQPTQANPAYLKYFIESIASHGAELSNTVSKVRQYFYAVEPKALAENVTDFLCLRYIALFRERAAVRQRVIDDTNLGFSNFFGEFANDVQALRQVHPSAAPESTGRSAMRLPKLGWLSTLIAELHSSNLEGCPDHTLPVLTSAKPISAGVPPAKRKSVATKGEYKFPPNSTGRRLPTVLWSHTPSEGRTGLHVHAILVRMPE